MSQSPNCLGTFVAHGHHPTRAEAVPPAEMQLTWDSVTLGTPGDQQGHVHDCHTYVVAVT